MARSESHGGIDSPDRRGEGRNNAFGIYLEPPQARPVAVGIGLFVAATLALIFWAL